MRALGGSSSAAKRAKKSWGNLTSSSLNFPHLLNDGLGSMTFEGLPWLEDADLLGEYWIGCL